MSEVSLKGFYHLLYLMMDIGFKNFEIGMYI